jgi:hypothetical protein
MWWRARKKGQNFRRANTPLRCSAFPPGNFFHNCFRLANHVCYPRAIPYRVMLVHHMTRAGFLAVLRQSLSVAVANSITTSHNYLRVAKFCWDPACNSLSYMCCRGATCGCESWLQMRKRAMYGVGLSLFPYTYFWRTNQNRSSTSSRHRHHDL